MTLAPDPAAYASRLVCMALVRSSDPHDGDTLRGEIHFTGEAELRAIFDKLGRPLVPLAADAPLPVPGESYTLEEYEAFATPIRAYPAFEAPGRTQIFGIGMYVAVGDRTVTFYLAGRSGDPYAVTAEDYEDAIALERGLREVGLLPPA